MKENPDVVAYYDEIADTYDQSRFSGTYGQFIDAQERAILRRFLPDGADTVVDLACGTGRLLDFASVGVDASEQMLRHAAAAYPGKRLIHGRAHSIPLAAGEVDAIYSFHLMMHLDVEYIRDVIAEARRLLRRGGALIFDFPSLLRRNMGRRDIGGWHGNTALTLDDVAALLPEGLSIKSSCGVMLLPVHRLPGFMRKLLVGVDSLLCRTVLKNYASYIVVKIVKS